MLLKVLFYYIIRDRIIAFLRAWERNVRKERERYGGKEKGKKERKEKGKKEAAGINVIHSGLYKKEENKSAKLNNNEFDTSCVRGRLSNCPLFRKVTNKIQALA